MSALLATVVEDIDLPTRAAPAGIRVTYDLVGDRGRHLREAYDTDGNTIVGHVDVKPEEGLTSVELVGNDDILPSGTAWRRSISIPHDPAPRSDVFISVPNDGGSYNVSSLLVDEPGALEPGALAAHRASVGVPLGHLPPGAPNVGDTILWDASANDGDGAFVYAQPGEVVELPRAYRHEQSMPAATWTVVHNLGYQPAGIYIEDSAGTLWGAIPDHIDDNTLTLTFPGAMDGFAYFS